MLVSLSLPGQREASKLLKKYTFLKQNTEEKLSTENVLYFMYYSNNRNITVYM